MNSYGLTVFAKNGETLLNEKIEAANDHEAKALAEQQLKEKGFEHHTSRLTSPKGQLLLFHR
ncbi:MAG TPA: YhzD family protein [Bacillales bacterium]|nr:YhzD family protein [Bacillales bacterium]